MFDLRSVRLKCTQDTNLFFGGILLINAAYAAYFQHTLEFFLYVLIYFYTFDATFPAFTNTERTQRRQVTFQPTPCTQHTFLKKWVGLLQTQRNAEKRRKTTHFGLQTYVCCVQAKLTKKARHEEVGQKFWAHVFRFFETQTNVRDTYADGKGVRAIRKYQF